MSELRDPYEPMATEANGLGPPDVFARARRGAGASARCFAAGGFHATAPSTTRTAGP